MNLGRRIARYRAEELDATQAPPEPEPTPPDRPDREPEPVSA